MTFLEHQTEHPICSMALWHDLRLPISINSQSEIQIDFVGLCIRYTNCEVKGGRVGIDDGKFCFSSNGVNYMDRSPFAQALLKFAIINNISFLVVYACASPPPYHHVINK